MLRNTRALARNGCLTDGIAKCKDLHDDGRLNTHQAAQCIAGMYAGCQKGGRPSAPVAPAPSTRVPLPPERAPMGLSSAPSPRPPSSAPRPRPSTRRPATVARRAVAANPNPIADLCGWWCEGKSAMERLWCQHNCRKRLESLTGQSGIGEPSVAPTRPEQLGTRGCKGCIPACNWPEEYCKCGTCKPCPGKDCGKFDRSGRPPQALKTVARRATYEAHVAQRPTASQLRR